MKVLGIVLLSLERKKISKENPICIFDRKIFESIKKEFLKTWIFNQKNLLGFLVGKIIF